MRKIGKVKYNGKSTADLGVIVSGEAAFDAAAPDYTSYQIPGKNGDLMLSNNRYLNIDVTYPAFIPADFEDKVQAIRNWMRSARSYARIEDNYDLLHYRMGMGKDVLPFEPTAENVGSNMSLVFDCKPQRFLYSGEEENQIGVWGPVQTASGDVVTFEDVENGAFRSIAASITPTQDLHGYDYPWPAGGGKNIFDYTRLQSGDGLTVTISQTGTVSISGLPTRENAFLCRYDITDLLQDGTYTLSQSQFFGAQLYSEVLSRNKDGTISYYGCANILSKNIPVDKSLVDAYEIYVVARKSTWGEESKTLSCTFQLEKGSTATTFTPYSNICPITGRTEATVWRTGNNLLDAATYRKVADAGLTVTLTDSTLNGYDATKIEISGTAVSYGWRVFQRNNIRNVLQPNTSYRLTMVSDVNQPFFALIATQSSLQKLTPELSFSVSQVGGLYQYVSEFTTFASDNPAWESTDQVLLIGTIPATLSGITFTLVNNICLTLRSATTGWEPYSGTSYPVSWQTEAGEVYGGTVDVVSGVLTVDRAMRYVDGSQNIYNVGYHGSTGLYYTVITNTLTSQEGDPSLISNRFRNAYNVGIGNCYVTNLGTTLVAVLPDQTITTREQAKQWFVDNPTQFVYALRPTQTYQLSGQQIKTLLGVNNVWADSGTVTAEWGEDPFGLYNTTLFDALPLIKVKDPQNGCAVTVNGTTMTCSRRYTGTVTIDCELMDVSSGVTNLNADWSKDFPKLSPGENSVAFSGADAVTIIPRWWEL